MEELAEVLGIRRGSSMSTTEGGTLAGGHGWNNTYRISGKKTP
jgi:hypothetical protein